MKAFILAAGYATRLWPLTLNRPKPLLLVNKRPIIEYIIAKLAAVKGIDKIFVVTNTKFAKNFREWKRSYKDSERISIVDDGVKSLQKRLGSIGDIIFTVEKKNVDSDILVIGGDNIFDFGITDFVKRARRNSPYATIGLFDIKDKSLAKKYGIVEIDKKSRIVSFEEKPSYPKSTLAAMCLYYFPKEKLRLLKVYKKESNPLDMAGCFIRWLSKKETVSGHVFKGVWLDIGDKNSLKIAEGINWK